MLLFCFCFHLVRNWNFNLLIPLFTSKFLFFIGVGWDKTPLVLLLMGPCASSIWYVMNMEHWWNDNCQLNSELLRRNCSSTTLSNTNPMWTTLGWNPGFLVGGQEQTTWPRTWHDLYITFFGGCVCVCVCVKYLLFAFLVECLFLSLSSVYTDHCCSIPFVRLDTSHTWLSHFCHFFFT